MNRLERIKGCLLGGAVGDALGAPVEFLEWPAIEAKFGPQGIVRVSQLSVSPVGRRRSVGYWPVVRPGGALVRGGRDQGRQPQR
ncbi:ADP-ribosylglycohydrolase family protein [Pseudomonas viridiflava]